MGGPHAPSSTVGVTPGSSALTPGVVSGTGAAAGTGGGGGAGGAGSKPSSGIKYRHVGKSGLMVSNLALGSMKLFSGGDANSEVAEEIVTTAYDRGVTFFDVSDPYSHERAEIEFGKIFAKKNWPRRSYVVCTKVYWGRLVK